MSDEGPAEAETTTVEAQSDGQEQPTVAPEDEERLVDHPRAGQRSFKPTHDGAGTDDPLDPDEVHAHGVFPEDPNEYPDPDNPSISP